MTITDVSPIVASIALAVSLFTLWFTVLRRGTVRSTHPSLIAFRYDLIGTNAPLAKIFLRTLLFSSAKRGQVVESLFLRVQEGSRRAEFSFWGHGDKDLVGGSGMFVPETGVVTNHHFNPLETETPFLFAGGSYSLELVAKLIGSEKHQSLWRVNVEMPVGAFNTPIVREKAVLFSWSPEQNRYVSMIEHRPESTR